MCGIGFIVIDSESGSSEPTQCGCGIGVDACMQSLRRRGPDQEQVLSVNLDQDGLTMKMDESTCDDSKSTGKMLHMMGAVLHLRGDELFAQPAVDEEGNVLLWNGEVFGGVDIPPGVSDSSVVAKLLARTAKEGAEAMTSALAQIQGPFALLYYHRAQHCLIVARDPLARRSLLVHIRKTDNLQGRSSLAIASTLPFGAHMQGSCVWDELPALGLYQLDLSIRTITKDGFQLQPWPDTVVRLVHAHENSMNAKHIGKASENINIDTTGETGINSVNSGGGDLPVSDNEEELEEEDSDVVNLQQQLQHVNGDSLREDTSYSGPVCNPDMVRYTLEQENDAVARLLAALRSSVRRRIENIPSLPKVHADGAAKVGVLFSGGLDSAVLASLVGEIYHADACKLTGEGETGPQVDLINVCFDVDGGHKSPDRLASILGWRELCNLYPSVTWNLILVNERYTSAVTLHGEHVYRLMYPRTTTMDFNIAMAIWTAASCKGILCTQEDVIATEHQLKTGDTHVHNADNRHKTLRYGTEHANYRGGERKQRPQIANPCAVSGCRFGRREGCFLSLCAHCCKWAQKTIANQNIAFNEWTNQNAGNRTSTANENEADAALANQERANIISVIEIYDNEGTCGLANENAGDAVTSNHSDARVSENDARVYDNHMHAHVSIENNDECMYEKHMYASMYGGITSASTAGPGGGGAHGRRRLEVCESLDRLIYEWRIQERADRQTPGPRSHLHICSVHKPHKLSIEPAQYGEIEPVQNVDPQLEVEDDVSESAEATSPIMYESSARVLLLGAGADEQMGGYTRHRNAFEIGGLSKLQEEINHDKNRLWLRNLGRDDRCVADRGREARFPFLDEEVVSLLASLPLPLVTDLTLAPGVGDKKILRKVAEELGLVTCRHLVKRAIQFGSRVAREHTTATSVHQSSGSQKENWRKNSKKLNKNAQKQHIEDSKIEENIGTNGAINTSENTLAGGTEDRDSDMSKMSNVSKGTGRNRRGRGDEVASIPITR